LVQFVNIYLSNPKKSMAKTIIQKTKGKAKERPTNAQPIGTNEGRELVPLMGGSYFTHIPFDVACM